MLSFSHVEIETSRTRQENTQVATTTCTWPPRAVQTEQARQEQGGSIASSSPTSLFTCGFKSNPQRFCPTSSRPPACNRASRPMHTTASKSTRQPGLLFKQEGKTHKARRQKGKIGSNAKTASHHARAAQAMQQVVYGPQYCLLVWWNSHY